MNPLTRRAGARLLNFCRFGDEFPTEVNELDDISGTADSCKDFYIAIVKS